MTWRPKLHRAEPEHKFHVSVARYLRLALPLDACFSTTPTVGSNVRQGAKIKARGYFAGWPDITIIWNRGVYFLELKSLTGTVSPEQRACHAAIMRAGGKIGMAKDLNDAEFWLQQWGIPLRVTVDPRQLSGARSIA